MNIIASRWPAIKFLGTLGLMNLGYTLFSKNVGQNIISIQDYLSLNIDERTQYSIMGIIKPRSVRLAEGLNKKFVFTDTENELRCKFEGVTTVEVKQGETAIVTAYCPDIANKENIIVKEYMTKHSMETIEWQAKSNVSKKSFGLEKYK